MDPLAEKYPNFNPYAYCFQNPIMYNDPTGMEGESPNDDFKLMKNGKLVLIKETGDNFDRIYNEDKSKSIQVDKGFINKKLISDKASFFVTTNTNQAKDAYKFFSDNSTSEFSLSIYSKNRDVSIIQTSYEHGTVTGAPEFALNMLNRGASLKYHSHSHPEQYDPVDGHPAYPSGFYNNLQPDFTPGKEGDRGFYNGLRKKHSDKIPTHFNIYVPTAPNLEIQYNFHQVLRK